ncbi:MAG TPA: adenosine deaminase [Anaerolineales bacterium]|nr:adenosine deaminase [Anaerolineales bacterium]
MSRVSDLTWFERLPKIELHLHLEGAIPYGALWDLVQKYDGDVPSEEALRRRFEYKDFAHFIETWIWKNQFLREYEDFTFIAEAAARDLAAQNICYAEVFFSPADFRRQGLKTQPIAEAIRTGLGKVDQVQVALVVDLVRDFGPEKGEITLAEASEVKQLGIVGVGIGGSEQDFPPEAFEKVFAKARKLGFHTSAHAGEAAGPESVWGAIRRLHVDRIGHATRAEEDERLLDYLVEQKIPIEMCPISNVRTGVVKSYEEHPVRRYFERGVALSINTDDPKMFGNSLAEEFRLLADKKGFAPDEIKRLLLGSIQMSWMPEEQKEEMARAFAADPAWSAKMNGG